MVPDFTGKRHHRAVFVALGQPAVFRADIEAFRSNNNPRVSHD
jgi:hypothetical protein